MRKPITASRNHTFRAFAAYFAEWREPWNFADAETTARRLSDADFVDIVTSVEPSPVIQPDAAAYREFVANVICRPFLARLPDEKLRDRFMDALTTKAAGDMPAFELDYWRSSTFVFVRVLRACVANPRAAAVTAIYLRAGVRRSGNSRSSLLR